MLNTLTKSILLLALCYIPFVTQAGPIKINYHDSGWYNRSTSNQYAVGVNQNYVVGTLKGKTYRNWFTFDLSGITQNIISAKLRLYTGAASHTGRYKLYDVSSNISAVIAGGNNKNKIYKDLGTGTLFGSKQIQPANNRKIINIALNNAALASLNNSIGSLWAIGGKYTNSPGYAFSFTNNVSYKRQLILGLQPIAPVPEPGAITLLLFGFVSITAFRSRRNFLRSIA